MKKFFAVIALYLAGWVSSNAYAESYLDLGYSMDSFELSDGTEFEPSTAHLTLGTKLGSNIAVEGVIGTGVVDDSQSFFLGNDITVEMNEFYGIYLRPFVSVTDGIELFARLGYRKYEATVSSDAGTGTENTDSDKDVSYGIGAAFNVSDATSILVDYMNYYDKENLEISGVSLGLRFAF